LAGALGPGHLGAARLDILLAPLPSAAAVEFRQAVFRDLEQPGVGDAVRTFGTTLDAIRTTLGRAERMRHPAERHAWILDAMERHDEAVASFGAALRAGPVASKGLAALRDHVAALTSSADFTRRREATAATRRALDAVAYRLQIGEHRVVVGAARDEPDLAAEIRATFARFSDGEPAPLPVDAFETLDMNPLEAAILARVARADPAPFTRLAALVADHQEVIDLELARISDEAAWYLAVLDVLAPLRAAGLGCSYPAISPDGALELTGAFDLELARRHVASGRHIATSDVGLAASERLAVVTGPSQGGRTSYARAIGQAHVLAAAGCPVPASRAVVPLVDHVLTVFDRPERLDDPGGRLRGELRRVRELLATTTPASLVIASEPFASTTATDALGLARRLISAVIGRGARAVVVTFLEELAEDPAAVSIAADVDSDDPAARTFRFGRRPADGLAHARVLASRHGLDADAVRARLRR
jgi:DNA mismatch repair protein MutS